MPGGRPERLKELHGPECVAGFAEEQSPRRPERLLKDMDLSGDHCVVDIACGDGLLIPVVTPRVAWYVGVGSPDPFIQAVK